MSRDRVLACYYSACQLQPLHMMAERNGFLVWCIPAGMNKHAVYMYSMSEPEDRKAMQGSVSLQRYLSRLYSVFCLDWLAVAQGIIEVSVHLAQWTLSNASKGTSQTLKSCIPVALPATTSGAYWCTLHVFPERLRDTAHQARTSDSLWRYKSHVQPKKAVDETAPLKSLAVALVRNACNADLTSETEVLRTRSHTVGRNGLLSSRNMSGMCLACILTTPSI